MQSDAETAADDVVVGSGMKPTTYAAHLLALAASFAGLRQPHTIGVSMLKKSSLENRVESLVDPTVRRTGPQPAHVAAFMILGLAILAGLAKFKPTFEGRQDIREQLVSDAINSLTGQRREYRALKDRTKKLLALDELKIAASSEKVPVLKFNRAWKIVEPAKRAAVSPVALTDKHPLETASLNPSASLVEARHKQKVVQVVAAKERVEDQTQVVANQKENLDEVAVDFQEELKEKQARLNKLEAEIAHPKKKDGDGDDVQVAQDEERQQVRDTKEQIRESQLDAEESMGNARREMDTAQRNLELFGGDPQEMEVYAQMQKSGKRARKTKPTIPAEWLLHFKIPKIRIPKIKVNISMPDVTVPDHEEHDDQN